MSEEEGAKHVFSFMDGIPVKISEKYKPPRKIVLPVGFQNRLLQPPVVPDYDFQLEREVIEKLHHWRSARSKEKECRRIRLAEENEKQQKAKETMQELEKTMNELSTEEEQPEKKVPSHTPSPVSVSSQQPIKAYSAFQPQQPVCSPVVSEGNPILRPIPIKHQVVSQINNNKPFSAFNLSDFEADTSSPFDNMELKTINDLEELAQVLQPSSVTQTPNFYQNSISTNEQFGNAHHQTINCQVSSSKQPFNLPHSDKMLNNTKCGVDYQSHINGFSSNYDYNGLQSYHPQSVIPQLNPHGQVSPYNYVERELLPHSSDHSFSYTHQEPEHQVTSYYSPNVWPSIQYQQNRLESFNNVSGNESNATSANVSFYPPLTSAAVLEQPVEKSPDMEAPINSMAQQLGQFIRTRASRNQPKPSEESTPENSSSAQSPMSPIEPDPFLSLQSESQQLVRKIAEMGFPRARVARACLKLGANEQKIVEFLLSLQSLLEANYPEARAEHALCLLNHDVKAAIKFLQVETQLLDLGFSSERVSEALVKFNCDRDQALEFLIS